jgi:hypothetical protein
VSIISFTTVTDLDLTPSASNDTYSGNAHKVGLRDIFTVTAIQ